MYLFSRKQFKQKQYEYLRYFVFQKLCLFNEYNDDVTDFSDLLSRLGNLDHTSTIKQSK